MAGGGVGFAGAEERLDFRERSHTHDRERSVPGAREDA